MKNKYSISTLDTTLSSALGPLYKNKRNKKSKNQKGAGVGDAFRKLGDIVDSTVSSLSDFIQGVEYSEIMKTDTPRTQNNTVLDTNMTLTETSAPVEEKPTENALENIKTILDAQSDIILPATEPQTDEQTSIATVPTNVLDSATSINELLDNQIKEIETSPILDPVSEYNEFADALTRQLNTQKEIGSKYASNMKDTLVEYKNKLDNLDINSPAYEKSVNELLSLIKRTGSDAKQETSKVLDTASSDFKDFVANTRTRGRNMTRDIQKRVRSASQEARDKYDEIVKYFTDGDAKQLTREQIAKLEEASARYQKDVRDIVSSTQARVAGVRKEVNSRLSSAVNDINDLMKDSEFLNNNRAKLTQVFNQIQQAIQEQKNGADVSAKLDRLEKEITRLQSESGDVLATIMSWFN